MKKTLATAVLAMLSGVAALGSEAAMKDHEESPVWGYALADIDGNTRTLGEFKGKVMLLVNTASKCGFTPQYEGLQALYERYRDRGLVVLAFPANNFLRQEPGTNQQIKEFCSTKFHVTFPVFEKISVRGKDIHPLYKHLTEETAFKGAISWNFNKFLVGRDGLVKARFGSRSAPLDKDVVKAVEEALGKR